MQRRSFLAGASALALLTATRSVVGATLSTFPGDTPGWAAVFGLKTMTQAVYQASFSTPQPCLDYEALDGHGNPVSSGTISFNNGKLDVAAIIALQEAGGSGIIPDLLGVPIPYGSDRQLFVSKWYDQSGAQNHVTQATAANRPVLAVIDGEPHLIFGAGASIGASSAALSFHVANVTVAVCCQPYVTGSGGQYNSGNGTLFSLSSAGDSQAVALGMPASVTTAFQTNTSLGANWLVQNDALSLRMPSAPFRVNKTSVTMSSGVGAIEVGAGNDVFSTPNPFAPYPNVSGTGIVIGFNFLGYIDAFMVKAVADTPLQTASYRSALDSAFGVNVDESYNVVTEGDFSAWGFGGLLPFIPESAQGRQGYGLTQFYMARLTKNARFNAVGTNNASWSDFGLRTAVIRNLYRPGATNAVILQNASGGVTDPSTYTAALLTWVSMLGGGWTVIVVDLPDLSGNATIRAINLAVQAAAAQGGYICVPSLTPSSWQNALERYDSKQLWGNGMYAGNLSPVGYSVLAAAEIPGINAALTESSLFPGDPVLGQSWAAVYGLKPMTKAIYDASFDIPQPCLDWVRFVDGTQSTGTINIKSGNLDVAAILKAQGPFLGTDGKPVPYCATTRLFVTRWYDQSGGRNDVTPVTAANLPGLAVIDGEPHLLFGEGTSLGASNAALSFSVASVTVAVCCQPFVTGTGGALVGNDWDPGAGMLFGLSSIDDVKSIMLGSPASVTSKFPHTPFGANWLIENAALPLAMPSAPFRLNKTSLTFSSGVDAIEVGASDDIFSTKANPFANYKGVFGNGIVIGRNFIGYIDAFMVKSGADIPGTTLKYRTALDCAYGVKVDESFNFVIDGDSSGWGYAGFFPHMPGSNQGRLGYGLSQFYMAGLCRHGRLNNIGTSGANWSDYQLRAAVVRNLYRPGATNIVILHHDNFRDGNGTPYTPQDYVNNLMYWISQLGAGWTILVVDLPGFYLNAADQIRADAINTAVREASAQGGYTCISSITPTAFSAAQTRYGEAQLRADPPHLSPVGFSVLTKPEIADINDFLRL